MGLVGTGEIMNIKLKVCNQKTFFNNIRAQSVSQSFIHLNDPYTLNGSYVNDALLMAIILNQAFCSVYDIWRLVYMIKWFLLF